MIVDDQSGNLLDRLESRAEGVSSSLDDRLHDGLDRAGIGGQGGIQTIDRRTEDRLQRGQQDRLQSIDDGSGRNVHRGKQRRLDAQIGCRDGWISGTGHAGELRQRTRDVDRGVRAGHAAHQINLGGQVDGQLQVVQQSVFQTGIQFLDHGIGNICDSVDQGLDHLVIEHIGVRRQTVQILRATSGVVDLGDVHVCQASGQVERDATVLADDLGRQAGRQSCDDGVGSGDRNRASGSLQTRYHQVHVQRCQRSLQRSVQRSGVTDDGIDRGLELIQATGQEPGQSSHRGQLQAGVRICERVAGVCCRDRFLGRIDRAGERVGVDFSGADQLVSGIEAELIQQNAQIDLGVDVLARILRSARIDRSAVGDRSGSSLAGGSLGRGVAVQGTDSATDVEQSRLAWTVLHDRQVDVRQLQGFATEDVEVEGLLVRTGALDRACAGETGLGKRHAAEEGADDGAPSFNRITGR